MDVSRGICCDMVSQGQGVLGQPARMGEVSVRREDGGSAE